MEDENFADTEDGEKDADDGTDDSTSADETDADAVVHVPIMDRANK